MKLLSLLFAIALSLILPPSANAHRKVISEAEAERWGFKPVEKPRIVRSSARRQIPYEAHSLNFPIELMKSADQFGPVMHQLQDWTKPAYFHAGVDIRADIDQPVVTPVAGRIEAGYYAYIDYPDGRSTKRFLSLEDSLAGRGSPPWGKHYFEVAVIDRHGYRFEFHHVNPENLPESVVGKILRGETVKENEIVGFIIRWPGSLLNVEYHHLHYNVVDDEGVYLNPFHLSRRIEDTTPPHIIKIHAVKNHTCRDGLFSLADIEEIVDSHIVVEVSDRISGGRFSNPPMKVSADFGGRSRFEWDFSRALISSAGTLPDLREIYLKDHCNAAGFKMIGSMSFRFFIKIPVPPLYNGPVRVEAIDQAGNSTHKDIRIMTGSI
jgi:hypothetical protein